MKFRFDENDDLVIDDIPDDMMDRLSNLAEKNGRSIEEEMRSILELWAKQFPPSEV